MFLHACVFSNEYHCFIYIFVSMRRNFFQYYVSCVCFSWALGFYDPSMLLSVLLIFFHNYHVLLLGVGFLGGSVVKNPPSNTGVVSINDPWIRKILWRRKWQPIAVILPGKSHAQRGLVGYSSWGRKELDTAQRPNMHIHAHWCSASINKPVIGFQDVTTLHQELLSSAFAPFMMES